MPDDHGRNDARRWLEETRDIVGRLHEIRDRIIERRAVALAPRTQIFADPRRNTGGHVDEVADRAQRLLDQEREDLRELAALVSRIRDAHKLCEAVRLAVGPLAGDAIELKYLRRMTWSQVAERIGMCERSARLYGSAALRYVDLVGIAGAIRGEIPEEGEAQDGGDGGSHAT